jgi:phospholipase/carboxylesterase
MFELDGPSFPPASGGAPRKLIVLLHGYGADGEDLIGLAQPLSQLLPDAAFHAPNAPYPCEGNPLGYQWFGISQLDPHLMFAGTRSAAPFAEAFLDARLKEYGLTEADTALIGFSQGTMMALHIGLRRARPVAGIVGFSGVLAGMDSLKDEIAVRPPVLLVHGDADELIPVALMHRTEQALKASGVPVESHVARGVGHGIDQTGLQLCARFLLHVLGGRSR